MKRTLIRCGWIVSLDDSIGDLAGADILLEDDRIRAIGGDLGEAETVIDARDMIAIPGLVDAHIHLWETGLKAIGCDWRENQYLTRVYAGMATHFGPEDNYIAGLVGALSRLDGGVTTLLDYAHNIIDDEQAERSVDALEDSGIRAVFALANGVYPPEREQREPLATRIHPRDRVARIRARLSSEERLVTMSLGVAGPHWAREEPIRANLAMARDFGLRTTSHATKRPEQELMPSGYSRLIAEGLLGQEHNIVHGNFLSDDELKRMVDAGITATSTVQTEVRGYARPPLVGRLLKLGALPSLGVDVEPKIPGDMFREMQLAYAMALNERVRDIDQAPERAAGLPPIRTREALRWATIGGAEALGLGHRTGTLTPGKQADIVLLRANDLNLFPVSDPLFSAVEFAHPGNVDTVLVGGRIHKRGGKLAIAETRLSAIRDQLRESVARIAHASGFVRQPS